jgi:hypothetical protein
MNPIVVHVTVDLPGRLRAVGLHVAEHANVMSVWCPRCSERQEYRRTADGGWEGQAFLHDDGCAHFRERGAP